MEAGKITVAFYCNTTNVTLAKSNTNDKRVNCSITRVFEHLLQLQIYAHD